MEFVNDGLNDFDNYPSCNPLNNNLNVNYSSW